MAVLFAVVALLVVYHFLAERRRSARRVPGEEEEPPEFGEALAAAPAADPDVLARDLPPGPRRDVVRRYLRHIERLRGSGIPPAVRALPRELADAFGRARWSERERPGQSTCQVLHGRCSP